MSHKPADASAKGPHPGAPEKPGLDWLACAARLAVGGVMVASGALKAAGPREEFALVIENYQLLPMGTSMTAATFLPWLELLGGMALIMGYFTRAAAATAAGLLGVFILALSSVKARGFELPNCGCFGGSFHPTPGQTLAMDVVLLALAILAYRHGRRRLSLDNWAAAGYTGAMTERP